ncbi:MAG: cytochrome c [Polyangiales bacterium]
MQGWTYRRGLETIQRVVGIVCCVACGDATVPSAEPPQLPASTLPPIAGSNATPPGSIAHVPPSAAAAGSPAPADAAPAPDDAATPPPEMTAPKTTSYHRDIRPVLESHCTSCHANGQAGATPIDSWETVQPLADAIARSVTEGTMPPWPADDSCRSLRDVRALPQPTRDLFGRWRDESFPEGDPLGYRAPPPAAKPVELGPASYTLGSYTAYTPPEASETYRCFIAEHVFDHNTYIRAVDILPDEIDEVHHVQVHKLTPEQREQLQSLDLISLDAGYDCKLGAVLAWTETMFSWRPGSGRMVFDQGDALYAEAGSTVMLEVHYNTQFLAKGQEPTPDRTKAQFWEVAAGTVPEHIVYRKDVFLPLTLKEGESNVVVEALTSMKDIATVGPTGTFVPGEIIGITPHAHHLATEMNAAVFSGTTGNEECLVRVPEWQYGHQLDYMFKQAIPYGEKDTVHSACMYDNSAANQPRINGKKQASKRVTAGEDTLQEMCMHYVWLRMDRRAFVGY